MANERTYQVISADGHLEIPAEPWLRHVPERHRDRAPRLVKLPEGGEGWLIEGQPMIQNGPNIAGGSPPRAGRKPSYWNPDGTPAPGTGDARQRLREQDADGIDAEVLFPPIFVSTAIQSIADKDVYRAVVRAYNSHLAQDFCPIAPDRLIACGVIPTSGVDDALAELRFCKEAGLRAVALSESPSGKKGPSPEDDRFWEAALALGMPLTGHVCFGTRYPPFITQGAVQSEANAAAAGLLTARQVGFAPMYTVAQLITSGVFDRLPELRLYFAETNASWMACALWQMDDNYDTWVRAGMLKTPLAHRPSEYFRRHVYCSFIRDPQVGRMLDVLPIDNLMFGSDFPHGVTSYPETQRWLDETFAQTPPAVRRKVLVETPARFFGLDPARPITPTPN
jgi:predicted TIM-barrel fold metal-dependent hydrolase